MIQIHGMDQTKILVLIDGVPYYETKYGKLDLNQIPVDNVAKIEVTKGSSLCPLWTECFNGGCQHHYEETNGKTFCRGNLWR